MNPSDAKTALIIMAIGNVLALLFNIIVSGVNVIAPRWINKPDVSIRYVEAIPRAKYKSFNNDMFSEFNQLRASTESMLYIASPPCQWQFWNNRISPYCKEEISFAIDQEINTRQKVSKLYNDYSESLSKIDFNEVTRLPAFMGNRNLSDLVNILNSALSFMQPLKNNPPDITLNTTAGDDIPLKNILDPALSTVLSALVGNIQFSFSQEVDKRQSYLSVLTGMRKSIEDMVLSVENGERTGEIYFKIGVHNTGSEDALISPISELSFGQYKLQLVPNFDRNYYFIVKAGQIQELHLSIDEYSAPKGAMNAWKEIILKEEQREFIIAINEEEKEIEFKGQLPITEHVYDPSGPFQSSAGNFAARY